MYFNVDLYPLSNIDDEPICQALTEIGEQGFQMPGFMVQQSKKLIGLALTAQNGQNLEKPI